jgi:hypothetical protein
VKRGPGTVAVIAALASFCLNACGYHVGGKAETMPKSVQTIAVLPFNNLTNRYKLADELQTAISREFISKTRFQVVSNRETADAVLYGAINQVATGPVIFDPATGKATIVQIVIVLQVFLKENATGKILFSNPPFPVSNNYEISIYANQYFDESNLALDRICADVARTVVSRVIENF